MVDDISCVKGCAQALVSIHCPHVSTASFSKAEDLEECIGLPALQPVPLSL